MAETETRAPEAGVVIFHTHPSGDPTPSDADLPFTRRMAYAAALVGVDLVDHLVLGSIGRAADRLAAAQAQPYGQQRGHALPLLGGDRQRRAAEQCR